MTEHHTAGAHGSQDGLWRWLLGGLVGGAIVLGLLVAAYAIGYNRGQDTSAPAPAHTVPAPAASTAAAETNPTPTTPGPAAATPALVARGKALYTSDGCAGCHSLTGAAGAGPTFKGLAGGTSTLTTGETVTADDAYLQRSITDPDAQIVKGYRAGIMPPAIGSFDLASKPDDVAALVAFIQSQQ